MKLTTNLIFAAFTAATLIPASVMAATATTKNQGYLVEAPGATVVTSGTGLCWQTSDWSAANGLDACGRPIQVVAAPVPAPKEIVVAAIAPVAPLPQKISFSGDAMFAFDQSVLKPEGKTMLDGLVQQLDGATFDTISATGHTDHYGSSSYNQKLSERRAQAVKDYLISKNVQANRIDAAGKGEMEPVTAANGCQGAKSTAVIACLQPDRRVDVELTGAKTIVSSL